MMIKIYHNNRCSKSRSALTILQESGLDFEIIYYLETPPKFEELAEIIEKLGIKPEELLRKTEPIYLEHYKGKFLNDNEWIKAMTENPNLIERPIVISGNKGVIARPTARIFEILG
jgi:arsenate reductase